MILSEYQRWLVDHGARLSIDGQAGPKTRAAPFAVFANRQAAAVSTAEKVAIARRLGGSVRQLDAVAAVESAGGGFQPDGLPKALYERHYFWKRVQVKIPLLSDPTPGGYTTDADGDGLNDNWEKLADAALRNPVAAFESASFGKFQIMGAWAERLGYGNALEFVWALSRSEGAHYEALARYIEANKLCWAFRRISADPKDCESWALGYNGKNGVRQGYASRTAAAFKAWRK